MRPVTQIADTAVNTASSGLVAVVDAAGSSSRPVPMAMAPMKLSTTIWMGRRLSMAWCPALRSWRLIHATSHSRWSAARRRWGTG